MSMRLRTTAKRKTLWSRRRKAVACSLGPSEEVIRRSDLRWKLSDLTFTHQMTRLLVLEQIYRAYMIRHHRPYHK